MRVLTTSAEGNNGEIQMTAADGDWILDIQHWACCGLAAGNGFVFHRAALVGEIE
jgi:hypothetical protein